MKPKFQIFLLIAILAVSLAACSSATEEPTGDQVNLILAAYTTPREAYGEIIPLFQAYWLEETGQEVTFEESYLGSGAQSRAVVEGFEADVVALSLEADVNRIQNAGLITHDWKTTENNGIVTTSVVSLAVREGNPKGISDWSDLTQPGLEILTPNPNTSGGAMWNVLAVYGAALRGEIDGVPGDDPDAAFDFLVQVLQNVSVMDKAARDSILNFEMGIGDLAITYENEILVGRQSGQTYERVIPSSTILIQNPVAVVDASVDEHGTRQVAEAFVNFLFTPEAQAIFARHGLRVVNEEVAAENEAEYPPVEDLFTVDYFGGWDAIMTDIFGEDGIYNQAIASAQGDAQ
ncbi:MAG: sulfate ABC transporter substrate-binding protein [Anaerolineaceae bacterium]|nr:sulfate ABC transporter substrate-binding protein [Anaerolineaceae bacterium]